MEIKDLTYKQFSLIREAIIEKREKFWKEQVEIPFGRRLKKMSFKEVKELRDEFNTIKNQFTSEGICNKILEILDTMEMDLQYELKNA